MLSKCFFVLYRMKVIYYSSPPETFCWIELKVTWCKVKVSPVGQIQSTPSPRSGKDAFNQILAKKEGREVGKKEKGKKRKKKKGKERFHLIS